MIVYAGMIRWNDGPEVMAEIREVSFQWGDKSLLLLFVNGRLALA
jgi:hypothetical protein